MSLRSPARPCEHLARPVIVVGAGPVGTTAALLIADAGIPVIILERHAEPHPLPRAVHLDDEATRILYRAGVGGEFLDRSRPCTGLRLLDARHRVMAEFGRAATGVHGVPQANMFHQPDLEQLLLSRVAAHPLITLHRTADVIRLDDPAGPFVPPCSPGSPAVTVTARTGPGGQEHAFGGCLVLGCDGAGSTIRDLAGLVMEDLGFTERWLVIDIRVAGALQPRTRRPGGRGIRAGSLIPNPLVRVTAADPVPLDAVLGGRTAVLTGYEPDQVLARVCERNGLALLRIRPASAPQDNRAPARPTSQIPAPQRRLDRHLPGRRPRSRPDAGAHRRSRAFPPRPARPRDRRRRRRPATAPVAMADPAATQPPASRCLACVPFPGHLPRR